MREGSNYTNQVKLDSVTLALLRSTIVYKECRFIRDNPYPTVTRMDGHTLWHTRIAIDSAIREAFYKEKLWQLY
jgi:hypothetical protein